MSASAVIDGLAGDDLTPAHSGVQPRSTNRSWSGIPSTIRVIDANDPASVLADVEPGMTVIGATCAKFGVVTKVLSGDDRAPVALTVSYGLLARKRKYVPGELVDLVDHDRVVLSIDSNQFKALRDIDD